MSKIKVLAEPCSFQRLQQRFHSMPRPPSGGCWYFLAWGHHITPVPPRSHLLLFCVSQSSLCPSLIRILMIAFRAPWNNPEWFPHLKSFNLVTSVKNLFPNKVTFTYSRNLTWILFQGPFFSLTHWLSVTQHDMVQMFRCRTCRFQNSCSFCSMCCLP